MKKIVLVSISIFGSLLLSLNQSCYYDNEEELYPNSMCDTSVTTFSAVVQPIIQNNCALSGCHVPGGTGIGDYTNYAGVKAAVDNGKIQNRVIDLKTMPPSSPLANCDILKLQKWINNGAQNN
ncbi:MAG: hypothetical protein KJO64_00345 [Bacteroidia bacterium]|nr:hypothetical protein [Bacteroidia bacterium]NNC85193.1 hypothetical protein [Bacteroidia bacterium]